MPGPDAVRLDGNDYLSVVDHPDIALITFTGSPEVGRLVGEACGRNLVPVKLELGGKGAAVVFDDRNGSR